jgi:hypothetical protein
VARRRVDPELGEAAVRSGDDTALAVRYLLQVLSDAAPGNTLEVQVPPYGAAQVVEGPRHTRGTPPNVVEMDAATWLAVATGSLRWAEAVAQHRVSASGSRADLAPYLPLAWAASDDGSMEG